MEDKFLENVRELVPSVKITFSTGYDNLANIEADWVKEGSVEDKRKSQLLSMNVKPKHKYATLDGHSFPNCKIYPLENKAETIFPLWSKNLSGGKIGNQEPSDKYTFASGSEPEYILDFVNAQSIRDIYIKGEEEWLQYPVDYDLIFKFEKTASLETRNYVKPNLMSLADMEKEPLYKNEYVNVNDKIVSMSSNSDDKTLTINIVGVAEVDNKKPIGQYVDLMALENLLVPKQDFFENNKVEEVTLKIKVWSEKHTTAKIMYFSTDKDMFFGSNEVESINVLEEKCESVDKLSYGITSNSVSVKVNNRDNIFIKEIERLKKNRLIEPSIKIKGGEEHKLGKFYSDSWDVTADSNFVTCRGYDILYNLQGLYIYYPLRLKDNVYEMDKDISAKQVFNTIFEEINKERRRCGIYGKDIEWEFHDVKEIKGQPNEYYVEDADGEKVEENGEEKIVHKTFQEKMKYVLLSYDKAWNMLNEMANYTRSYIYVDRNGKVIIERDGYLDKSKADIDKIKINSSNAFTYNLPTLCKTIANRVVVKYKDLKVEEKVKPIMETITVDDFKVYNNIAVCKVELKNYAVKIDNKNILIDKYYFINSIGCKEILFYILDYNDEEKLEFTIAYDGLELEDKEHVAEDEYSLAINGLVEYENDCNIIFGVERANEIANKILENYAKGKSYIETKWIGTPNLKLNDSFKSSSKYLEEKDYQCMSNEFTIEHGLRVKTKAIQIV